MEDNIDKNEAEVVTNVPSEKESGAEESVVMLVNAAEEALVRNFLAGILENDEKLLNRFKSALCREISPVDMKR
nr:hypothetical protein [Evansella caseinilytica]